MCVSTLRYALHVSILYVSVTRDVTTLCRPQLPRVGLPNRSRLRLVGAWRHRAWSWQAPSPPPPPAGAPATPAARAAVREFLDGDPPPHPGGGYPFVRYALDGGSGTRVLGVVFGLGRLGDPGTAGVVFWVRLLGTPGDPRGMDARYARIIRARYARPHATP